MKTTVVFNIRIHSNNAKSAVSQLINAGLNPFFRKFSNQKNEQLCVTVDKGSILHGVAKNFQFDYSFNCN